MNQKPRVVGEKYEIERHLATGGMGELYVARHVLTTQRVALKVLDRRLARSETSIERFLREVRLAAKIGHPAIVQIYDAGLHVSDDGVPMPFLAMELLAGQNLSERIVRGDVSQADVMAHIAAVLEPLAAAHAKGVVHRDLKPENVFLQRLDDGTDRVRLLDFGIAREADDLRKATLAGQALGTVYYMAPEQSLDARSVTAVSDVWSLGAMMYQCLSGEFPFDGETAAAVLLRACRDPHRPLASLRPDLDARLTALVDRCLSKDVLDRPAHATELREQLAPLLADPSIHASLAACVVTTWTYQPVDPPPFDDPFASNPLGIAPRTPSYVTAPPSATPPPPAPAATASIAPPPPALPGRSRRSLVLLAVAVPLLAGLWLALRAPTPSPTRPAPAAPAASAAPAAPTVIATPRAAEPAPTPPEPAAPAQIAAAPASPTQPPPPTPRSRRSRAAGPTPPSAAAPATPLLALPELPPTLQPPAPRAHEVAAPAREAPPPPTPVVTTPAPVVSPPPARPATPPPAAPPAPDFVTF